jgi:hypothetical protein
VSWGICLSRVTIRILADVASQIWTVILARLINGSSHCRVDKCRFDGTNSNCHGGIKARRILSLQHSSRYSRRACLGRNLGGVRCLLAKGGESHPRVYRHLFSTMLCLTIQKQLNAFPDLLSLRAFITTFHLSRIKNRGKVKLL